MAFPANGKMGAVDGNDLAVDLAGLTKRFKGQIAVNGLSLKIPRGCIYGILGPNGAGKTTTLRMLLGIIPPDAGYRSVLGGLSHLEAAPRIGYLSEERGLYRDMRVIDAIIFSGALRGLARRVSRQRGKQLLADHGLADISSKRVKDLSKGMAQIVQMIGAIIHDPELLVLDEPFSGLDAFNQAHLERVIRTRAAAGTTIIFSTHVIAHAERLCDRVAILGKGCVRFEGGVTQARDRLPVRVRLGLRGGDEAGWRSILPGDACCRDGVWVFELGVGGMPALIRMLGEHAADVTSISVERASLHEVFVDLVGEDWAQDDDEATGGAA